MLPVRLRRHHGAQRGDPRDPRGRRRGARGDGEHLAVCCGILPSYLGNRRWTWGRDGRGSLTREVVPFWALSIAGLLVSTLTVAAAGALTASWSPGLRSLVLPVVQAATFAALWVVQFVVLDRVIFRTNKELSLR